MPYLIWALLQFQNIWMGNDRDTQEGKILYKLKKPLIAQEETRWAKNSNLFWLSMFLLSKQRAFCMVQFQQLSSWTGKEIQRFLQTERLMVIHHGEGSTLLSRDVNAIVLCITRLKSTQVAPGHFCILLLYEKYSHFLHCFKFLCDASWIAFPKLKRL